MQYSQQYQSMFLGGVIKPESSAERYVNPSKFKDDSSHFAFKPQNYTGRGFTNYSWKMTYPSLPLTPWQTNTALELAQIVYPDGVPKQSSTAQEAVAKENAQKAALARIKQLTDDGKLNEARALQEKYFPEEIFRNEIQGLQTPLRDIRVSANGHHAAALSQRAAILAELKNLASKGLVSGGGSGGITSIPGMVVSGGGGPPSTPIRAPSGGGPLASSPSSSVPGSPSSIVAMPAVDIYGELAPFVESKIDPKSVPDTTEKLWEQAFSTIDADKRGKTGEQMFEKLKTIASSRKSDMSSNEAILKQLREAVAVSYLVKNDIEVDKKELKYILEKLDVRIRRPETVELKMPDLVSAVIRNRTL